MSTWTDKNKLWKNPRNIHNQNFKITQIQNTVKYVFYAVYPSLPSSTRFEKIEEDYFKKISSRRWTIPSLMWFMKEERSRARRLPWVLINLHLVTNRYTLSLVCFICFIFISVKLLVSYGTSYGVLSLLLNQFEYVYLVFIESDHVLVQVRVCFRWIVYIVWRGISVRRGVSLI